MIEKRKQVFFVPVNPEPWKVPPASVGRKGKALYVQFGRDEQGATFKEAVRESLIAQGAYMMDPPYAIDFWFSRQLAKNKNPIDATNMQKLTEDALQGLVIGNDRDVCDIHSRAFEQGPAMQGMILIIVREAYVAEHVPAEYANAWTKMWMQLENGEIESASPADKIKDSNAWP